MPVPAPTAPSAIGHSDAAATARPASAASTWTGYASLRWLSSHSPTTGMTTSSVPLEREVAAGRARPPAVMAVHSGNLGAVRRMELAIESIRRLSGS